MKDSFNPGQISILQTNLYTRQNSYPPQISLLETNLTAVVDIFSLTLGRIHNAGQISSYMSLVDIQLVENQHTEDIFLVEFLILDKAPCLRKISHLIEFIILDKSQTW